MGWNKLDRDGGDVFKSALDTIADPDQLYGVISARQIAKYASGARTILKVNDEIVGFAFAVSWNISTEHRDIFTIDSMYPEDTAPSLVQVSCSISGFHIPGDSPSNREMQANRKSFLHHKYIDIEVRDSQTDEILFKANKAYITNRSQAINAGELSKMTLQFRAIGWLDDLTEYTVEGVDNNGLDEENKPKRLPNEVL